MEKLEKTIHGWVVINIGHPTTGTKYIVESTFSGYRKDAVSKFIDGTNETWEYWKKKYNFRVVRGTQIVNTDW